jgi:hypothetical protein
MYNHTHSLNVNHSYRPSYQDQQQTYRDPQQYHPSVNSSSAYEEHHEFIPLKFQRQGHNLQIQNFQSEERILRNPYPTAHLNFVQERNEPGQSRTQSSYQDGLASVLKVCNILLM